MKNARQQDKITPRPGRPDPPICWYDAVGDRWEAEGADPGRIFEAHNALKDGFLVGVMIMTSDRCPPGRLPRHPGEIKKVCVRYLNGTEIEYLGTAAIVRDNFRNFRFGMT